MKRKTIKLSKTLKKNILSGLGEVYNNKILAVFGLKLQKNKKFNNNIYPTTFNLEKTNFNLIQTNKMYNKKQSEIKLKQLNVTNSTYKGVRIKLKLPLRGQRTHTNAQTARKNINFIIN